MAQARGTQYQFLPPICVDSEKRNTVKGLVDELGVKHEEIGVMKTMVKEYFANLFTYEVHEIDQDALRDVNRRVPSPGRR